MNIKLGITTIIGTALMATFPLLLVGCNSRAGHSARAGTPAAQAAPTPAARAQFLAAYRRAHETSDVDAALRLVCRDGLAEDMLQTLRQSLSDGFERPLKTVEIVPIEKSDKLEYTLGGVRYVPNLKPVGKLSITLATAADSTCVTTYLVGVKDGRYWIASATPAR